MGTEPVAPPRETRFPIPLVGAAAILVMLILLTPVLITGGGAGSLIAQADLVVDHSPNSFATYFYVRGVGVVRYAEIRIGLNQDYIPNTPGDMINWTTWVNATNQVSLYTWTNDTSAAVNVSVYYLPTTGSGVWYYGILASSYNVEQSTVTLTPLVGGLSVPRGPISTVNGHTFPLAIALAYQDHSAEPP